MTLSEIKQNFYTEDSANLVDAVGVAGMVNKIDIEQEVMNFPLIPYLGRVYIVEEDVTKTRGGIYVPETSKKDGEMQTNVGWVVGIGEDVTFCDVGERVYYGRYSGAYIMDKKYRVMNEKDLLGKFK